MSARRVTLRVRPPVPIGEVTLIPTPLARRSRADMARAMAAAVEDIEAPTAAEALSRLRQAFPLTPLADRLAALSVIMDRWRRAF